MGKPRSIAILDYGLGNLGSVAGALEWLGCKPQITRDARLVAQADKLIIPGVGAFGDGMRKLREFGLVEVLNNFALEQKKPVLGICLGFQLMAKKSEEFGQHNGLGWLDAEVVKLDPGPGLRLPHVGWNDLFKTRNDGLWQDVPDDALCYYVHSYHVHCANRDAVLAECEHGQRFTAAVGFGNIRGVQFHPEKSQRWGLQILKNFVDGVS